MLRLEPRREPSQTMVYATPFMAVALTLAAGFLLFAGLGRDPLQAMFLIFVKPLLSLNGIAELTVKATPLVLISDRAGGRLQGGRMEYWRRRTVHHRRIDRGSVALAAYPAGGVWLLPLMMLTGILGGMAWAAIPALLRTRFNANEILVSLMLSYVAVLLLSLLVHGVLRDPEGANFPESRLFQPAGLIPNLIAGTRAHFGAVAALIAVAATQLMLSRHLAGYQVKVLGMAPRAARFAGFSERRIVWGCFLLSGGLAGLAGLIEAAGPVGQLVPSLPVGYGFTAIIVAFLGRLHPVGILFAGLLIGLTYIGGEAAQIAHAVAQRDNFNIPGSAVVLPARKRRAGALSPSMAHRADCAGHPEAR